MDRILKKNFSYLFLLQNANYIIPLFLLPYLTRVLGAENFGKISFVQAFIAYFVLITEYGFNTSATRDVVQIREDKRELSRIFWSTTFAKIILAVSGFILLMFLILSLPRLREAAVLLVIAFSGVIASVLFPVWLFQGLERMSFITWLNVIPRLVVLAATFLLVKTEADYVTALSIQSAGLVISSLACIILIYKQRLVGFYRPSFTDIGNVLKEGWHIFISGVATNFYTTTNTVVLGFMTNDAAVGIFSASEKIVRAIISLLSSMNQVIFPRINSYYKESKEKAIRFGCQVLKYSGLITLSTGILLFVLAPAIVKILFGLPQYAGTVSLIRISSLLPFFAVCNGILAVNFLITFDLKKKLVSVVGAGCIFSLLIIVPAVLFYEARGVAFVALFTEILISLLLVNVVLKNFSTKTHK